MTFAVEVARGDERGRHAALHVVRAAAVDTTVAHVAAERIGHRRTADGVEVAEQHDAATTAAATVDEHGRPAGSELVQLDRQAVRVRPVDDRLRRSCLTRARRIERGIDRLRSNERRRQLRELVHGVEPTLPCAVCRRPSVAA